MLVRQGTDEERGDVGRVFGVGACRPRKPARLELIRRACRDAPSGGRRPHVRGTATVSAFWTHMRSAPSLVPAPAWFMAGVSPTPCANQFRARRERSKLAVRNAAISTTALVILPSIVQGRQLLWRTADGLPRQCKQFRGDLNALDEICLRAPNLLQASRLLAVLHTTLLVGLGQRLACLRAALPVADNSPPQSFLPTNGRPPQGPDLRCR